MFISKGMIIPKGIITGVVPRSVLLKGHPYYTKKSTKYMEKVHIFAHLLYELSKILLDLTLKVFKQT